MYDVMNPAAPQKLGSVNTQLSGIGAVAISGNRVSRRAARGGRVLDIKGKRTHYSGHT